MKQTNKDPNYRHVPYCLMIQNNETVIKVKRITSIAGELHNEWRKSQKNKRAIEADIGNTSYEDLPSDWQAENKASAEVAIAEVETAIREGRQLDDTFIEEASSALHDKWLERNGSWAPPEQNKPYSELTEEEKEKDRVIIRKAIEVVE